MCTMFDSVLVFTTVILATLQQEKILREDAGWVGLMYVEME